MISLNRYFYQLLLLSAYASHINCAAGKTSLCPSRALAYGFNRVTEQQYKKFNAHTLDTDARMSRLPLAVAIRYEPPLFSGPAGDATRELLMQIPSAPVRYEDEIRAYIRRILPLFLDDMMRGSGMTYKEYLKGNGSFERFLEICLGFSLEAEIPKALYVTRKIQSTSKKIVDVDTVNSLLMHAENKSVICASALVMGCATVQLQSKDPELEALFVQTPAPYPGYVAFCVLQKWLDLASQL